MSLGAAHGVDPIEHLEQAFVRRGGLAYGEAVTQLEHALQCATAAERAGASSASITAALLHDFGHLLHPDAGGALADGVDDRHEWIGANHLAQWFGEAVTQPIALHVEAKRYLCLAEPRYHASLSPVSLTTLRLQGGVMTPAEATAFLSRPHAATAVQVRRWDEAAKITGMVTAPLAHFLQVARLCRR